MCYDNLEEIGQAVDALRRAKQDRDEWTSATTPAIGKLVSMQVTFAEGVQLLDLRITRGDERLRELGFSPVKRVQSGDTAAELEAQGHTLPGKLPMHS